MGTWSTRIFDDDGAEDIRGEYRILLGYNLEPEHAWQLIYDNFYPDYEGTDEEDVFWLSTALFQWQNGILQEDVKQQALRVIESGSDLKRWEESGTAVYNKRKETLEQLKDKLLHEVNPPKKIRKCLAYYRKKTKFQLGDIYAYAHENGKYSYIQVVEIGKHPVCDLCPELDYSSWSNFALLDLFTDKLLNLEELTEIKYRKFYITHPFDAYRVECVDTIHFEDEKQTEEMWIYLGNRDLLETGKEWHGGHMIYKIYPERNEYEPYCIEPTFSLPYGITDEMLNAAFTEWLKDNRIETLEKRLSKNNPEWEISVCHVLKKVIRRGVQMYVSHFRMDLICETDPWSEENIYDYLPWLSNENAKQLSEQLTEKVETEEFDQWEDYLSKAIYLE